MNLTLADTRPAVFLDKDGTLLYDVPFNVDPARIRWRTDTFDALRMLRDAGFRLVMVTNQSGLARGIFTEAQLDTYLHALSEAMRANGVPLDGMLYCPHHPEGTVRRYRRFCSCRKPNPGMLLRAAHTLDIDLDRSWMIGDILDDIEAGYRAGCSTALLRTVGTEDAPVAGPRRPDLTAGNLTDLAISICRIVSAVAS